nr:unnamed protein product [Callosobruchus analis]
MFNMFRRIASEAPTLSPGFKMWTSLMISIVPLEILVGILRAWKKEVFSGPNPVFCAEGQWHQHEQVHELCSPRVCL